MDILGDLVLAFTSISEDSPPSAVYRNLNVKLIKICVLCLNIHLCPAPAFDIPSSTTSLVESCDILQAREASVWSLAK